VWEAKKQQGSSDDVPERWDFHGGAGLKDFSPSHKKEM